MSRLVRWARRNRTKATALGGGSALALLVVIGAVGSQGNEDPVLDLASSPSPTGTATTPDPAGAPRPPARAAEARVVAVTDGDTVVLDGIDVGQVDRRTGGRKSRLVGIDTPEVHGQAECYGREASAFTKRELLGEPVLVDFDVERIDRYDRALVYLWTPDGAFFNARLAAEGYAQQLTIPPNVRYAELFTRLVREAREASRGLWSGCPDGE